MKIKGLDNGYLYTKDDEKRIFSSSYSRTNNTLNGTIHLNIDGQDYFVGTGNTTVAVDKTDLEITKACTIANLCITGDTDYCLVVGLPINQYKSQKDKFRDAIYSYNYCNVLYNGLKRVINIKDIFVFPQCAAALYSLSNVDGDYILFDVGGYTLDIALIEIINGTPTISKSDTWYRGMVTFYSKVIEAVNLKFNANLEPCYAQKILSNGLEIVGKKEDIQFLQPVIQEYLEPTINEIRINYPSRITPIYMHGGGSYLLFNIFKKFFPNVKLIDDCQFANAKGYYNVGVKKFGKYLNQTSMRR